MVLLTACGGSSVDSRQPDSGPDAGPTTSTTSPVVITTEPDSPSGSLAAVLDRGSLRVGLVTGTPLGQFDRRLAEAIAAEIDSALFVQFVEVDPATRFDLLESGQIDLVMGGVARTTARDERFGRTGNYLMDGIAALVPEDSDIVDASDLDGLTIAVTEGTSLGIFLTSALDARGITTDVRPAPDPLSSVTDGEADAATTSIIDGLTGRSGFRPVPIVADTGVAILTRLEDAELTAALDEALRRIVADGRWEQFFRETFGIDAPWTLSEMAAAGPLD